MRARGCVSVAMLGFFTVNCYSYTTKWDGLIRPNGVVVYCACDCVSEHARYVGSIPFCAIFFFIYRHDTVRGC